MLSCSIIAETEVEGRSVPISPCARGTDEESVNPAVGEVRGVEGISGGLESSHLVVKGKAERLDLVVGDGGAGSRPMGRRGSELDRGDLFPQFCIELFPGQIEVVDQG